MRLIVDKIKGSLIFKVLEKPAFFTDEKLNFEVLNRSSKTPYLQAFYSKDGELVEIHLLSSLKIDESDQLVKIETGLYLKPEDASLWISPTEMSVLFGMPEKDTFKFFRGEINIPERFPERRYVFTFGPADSVPKICADHYAQLWNTDDRFLSNPRLTVERMDGGEMSREEIDSLRDVFYRDAIEWFTSAGAFSNWGIESVYFNKKLHFWSVDEEILPESWEELKNKVTPIIDLIYGVEGDNDGEIDGIRFFSVNTSDGRHIHFVAGNTDLLSDKADISMEEIPKIIKELLVEGSENVFVGFFNLSQEDAMAVREVETKRNSRFLEFKEFVCEYYRKKANLNDYEALENPEEWEEKIRFIFYSP